IANPITARGLINRTSVPNPRPQPPWRSDQCLPATGSERGRPGGQKVGQNLRYHRVPARRIANVGLDLIRHCDDKISERGVDDLPVRSNGFFVLNNRVLHHRSFSRSFSRRSRSTSRRKRASSAWFSSIALSCRSCL